MARVVAFFICPASEPVFGFLIVSCKVKKLSMAVKATSEYSIAPCFVRSDLYTSDMFLNSLCTRIVILKGSQQQTYGHAKATGSGSHCICCGDTNKNKHCCRQQAAIPVADIEQSTAQQSFMPTPTMTESFCHNLACHQLACHKLACHKLVCHELACHQLERCTPTWISTSTKEKE